MSKVYIITIASHTKSWDDEDDNHCVMGVYSSYEKAKANVIAKMQEYVSEYFYKGNLFAEDIDDNWNAIYKADRCTTMYLSAFVTPYEVE